MNIKQMHLFESSNIEPLKVLETFSPDEYENVVKDWVDGFLKKQNDYRDVYRLGGTGDKGRDVIACYDKERLTWDNYQCKHYSNPLNASLIRQEIGKLCYYTFNGDYPLPQNYFFVALKGITPEAHDLIYYKKDDLKEQLIKKWNKECKRLISIVNGGIPLSKELENYIKNDVDFSIFDHISPDKFIEQFKTTNYYAFRFKQDIKLNLNYERNPPSEIDQVKESNYLNHLFDAYSDHNGNIVSKEHIPDKYKNHFKRQRKYFYCADLVEKITRDSCPSDIPFKNLREGVHDAIINCVENSTYPNGYERLNDCLKEAKNYKISGSSLIKDVVDSLSQQGICHHLANDDIVKWVKNNENL